MTTPLKANDKYRATLRSTWIASPADAELLVTAIPTNLPTEIVVGWNTDYETVFTVDGTSGDNSSNYALTGVTRVKGANTNIPANTAVNCLNNEEYFNQYATMISDTQAIATGAAADAAEAVDASMTATGITSGATITPARVTQRNLYSVTALAVTGAFQPPSGTAKDGDSLVIRIKDNGTARALTWSGTGYVAGGSSLPSTTVTGKYTHVGFQYVTSNSLNKWMCIASAQEA